MAEYQIMYWKEIPAQVRAGDAGGQVTAELDRRFQEAIDALAMQEGLMHTDDYLEGWHWGEPREAPGPAETVLARVIGELDNQYPRHVDELVEQVLEAREGR